MSYTQTHTIELSSETLIVKASLDSAGRRLTLTSKASSKETAVRSMELFLNGLKAKLEKEKED